jgi:hypothetical protein
MRLLVFKLTVMFAGVVASMATAPCMAQDQRALGELKTVAEEAYLYGFPMIVNYKVLYEYNVDRPSGQFKASFNEINNEARVFTPKDTTISTPNSDTPYSLAQLDLRAEPVVLCMPEIEKARYYDVQLVDMYTDNYGFFGQPFSLGWVIDPQRVELAWFVGPQAQALNLDATVPIRAPTVASVLPRT